MVTLKLSALLRHCGHQPQAGLPISAAGTAHATVTVLGLTHSDCTSLSDNFCGFVVED